MKKIKVTAQRDGEDLFKIHTTGPEYPLIQIEGDGTSAEMAVYGLHKAGINAYILKKSPRRYIIKPKTEADLRKALVLEGEAGIEDSDGNPRASQRRIMGQSRGLRITPKVPRLR